MSVAPPPPTVCSWTNCSCLHGNRLLISHCVKQRGSFSSCCHVSPLNLSITAGATVGVVLIVASLSIYCDTETHQINVILPCMFGCCFVRRRLGASIRCLVPSSKEREPPCHRALDADVWLSMAPCFFFLCLLTLHPTFDPSRLIMRLFYSTTLIAKQNISAGVSKSHTLLCRRFHSASNYHLICKL